MVGFIYFLFAIYLGILFIKLVEKDFWYDAELDMWFPKCHKCKGKRDNLCPKTCLGDIL